jgi:hypothetical protein
LRSRFQNGQIDRRQSYNGDDTARASNACVQDGEKIPDATE